MDAGEYRTKLKMMNAETNKKAAAERKTEKKKSSGFPPGSIIAPANADHGTLRRESERDARVTGMKEHEHPYWRNK